MTHGEYQLIYVVHYNLIIIRLVKPDKSGIRLKGIIKREVVQMVALKTGPLV